MRRAGNPPPAADRGRLWRSIRIGPGLLLAIALSVAIRARERPTLPVRNGGPPVERTITPTARPGSTPQVTALLDHQRELRLTAAQKKALGQVAAEWRVESAELRAEMARAEREFHAYMAGARERGGEGAAEIGRHAQEASALTTRWLAGRADYWHRGLETLSPAQRREAEKLLLTEPTRGPLRATPGREREAER